jgi:hypothetical protein
MRIGAVFRILPALRRSRGPGPAIFRRYPAAAYCYNQPVMPIKKYRAAACLAAGFLAPSRAADVPFTRIVVDASSPTDPWMKLAGDFTGDGYPDIMVCGATGPLILYAYPDWKQSEISPDAASESGSASADIDGDGDLDAIVGTAWYENPVVGGKAGSLPWAGHTLGTAGTHDIATADIDKDGKLDVIMRSESAHDVYLFRQVSPLSWTRKVIPYSAGYNGLAVGDLDNDGDADIVVPGAWLENPGGDFATAAWAAHPIGAWDDFAAIQAADLNGDGLRDVVMTVSESAGKLAWFQAPSDPKTGAWIQHVIDPGPVTNAHAVEAADIDRDGDPDIITSEYAGSGRLLIYANGGKAASWTRQVIGTPRLHNIRIADFGKDGDLDIVGAYAWEVNPIELWRNDSPATGIARAGRGKARGAYRLWEIQGKRARGPSRSPRVRVPEPE